jgi:cell division protein FtsB
MSRKNRNKSDRKISEILRQIKRKKHLKHFLLLGIVAIFFTFFASGSRGTYQLGRFINQKNQLQEENTKLEDFKNKIENDPEYIEKIAREKYKMKKEGEQVYQIVEDD